MRCSLAFIEHLNNDHHRWGYSGQDLFLLSERSQVRAPVQTLLQLVIIEDLDLCI
jgi:hypothetical protein